MKKKRRASDIQSVIMTVLSLMTVITSISMGLLLYNRYETAMRQNDVRDAQNMMETIVNSMEQYLKSMRQISDTANYNIIQALDISSPEFNQELSLLYDSNKDKIQSIALYDMEGELLVAHSKRRGLRSAGSPGLRTQKRKSKICIFPHLICRIYFRMMQSGITG